MNSSIRLCLIASLLGCLGLAINCHAQTARDQELNARFGGNSTKKIRALPEGLAAKAGSAIGWQQDLPTAIELSRNTGKPIFLYVPTLRRTFMDRKPVIDQYMKAGPFSWPAIIALINDNYVPLVLTPDEALAQKFELVPYKFIEPGFVVIQGDKALQRIDRLTTLHPLWIFGLIAQPLNQKLQWDDMASSSDRKAINQAWSKFLGHETVSDGFVVPAEDRVELELLRGMQIFSAGRHSEAKELWQAAAQQFPDHPLSWKASAESQGIGPFVRGFEVFSNLSDRQSKAGRDSLGSAAPLNTFTVDQIYELSSRFLLDNQRDDGGFYDCDYDFGGFDSLPNIYTAVTAICGWAMWTTSQHVQQPLKAKLQAAALRAAQYCADDTHINPKDRDEILWAEAYRLRFLAALYKSKDTIKSPVVSLTEINRIAKRLEDIQAGNGSWFHEYPNSFVTATALIALKDAANSGASVDKQRVELGLGRLDSQRFSNGAYPYAVRRANSRVIEPVVASSGRIPVCSMALRVWDKEDDKQLITAAQIGLDYHGELAKALKYDNHTDTYAFGGFFFWYDMHARSEAISAIVDVGLRKELAARQRQLILELPELDGCFVDSHELGRCYGTSMALLSLGLVKQEVSQTPN